MKKKSDLKLMIVQPLIAPYRMFLFNGLAKKFRQTKIVSHSSNQNGFREVGSPEFSLVPSKTLRFFGLYYQTHVLKTFLFEKPEYLLMTADFRAIHFWLIIFFVRYFSKTEIFVHGQGMYNKIHHRFYRQYRMAYRLVSARVHYICYTKEVMNQMIAHGIAADKLSFAQNTIENKHARKPIIHDSSSTSILYVGRLRYDSGLDLLFRALSSLEDQGINLNLLIIGDGVERKRLETLAKKMRVSAVFYGAIYDDAEIARISANTSIGVYPGDAGLSLVHYMSLGLAPIVHNELSMHMGPEPGYVIDGHNGYQFRRNNAEHLASVLVNCLADKAALDKVRMQAYQCYEDMQSPSLCRKMSSIIIGNSHA